MYCCCFDGAGRARKLLRGRHLGRAPRGLGGGGIRIVRLGGRAGGSLAAWQPGSRMMRRANSMLAMMPQTTRGAACVCPTCPPWPAMQRRHRCAAPAKDESVAAPAALLAPSSRHPSRTCRRPLPDALRSALPQLGPCASPPAATAGRRLARSDALPVWGAGGGGGGELRCSVPLGRFFSAASRVFAEHRPRRSQSVSGLSGAIMTISLGWQLGWRIADFAPNCCLLIQDVHPRTPLSPAPLNSRPMAPTQKSGQLPSLVAVPHSGTTVGAFGHGFCLAQWPSACSYIVNITHQTPQWPPPQSSPGWRTRHPCRALAVATTL